MSASDSNVMTVLFQGDSITDVGRSRENPDELGAGYPMIAASWFYAMNPEQPVRFLNRGVSGDKVRDLKARWTEDCVDLQPDVVSILVGINDTWHQIEGESFTSMEDFESDYREIIERTLNETSASLIIMEPYVLPYPEDRKTWRENLNQRIEIVRSLAQEYHVTYVPLDGILAAASCKRECTFWAPDGVHPSPAGHALIAQAFLEALEEAL